MKHITPLLLGLTVLVATFCTSAAKMDNICRVQDGNFIINGTPYYYIGTNFWYGPILAADCEGGNLERLTAELDSLKAIGVDNLRVLAGGDGLAGVATRIEPTLQPEPGVYDEALFVGLDRFLVELGKRDMKAVLYINNSWEWSGGYWQYLEWAGAGKAVIPSIDGWQYYMATASQFIVNDKAKELFANHVDKIVSRVNSITGKPYSEDPAIFSWQICNEPRCFSREDSVKTAFVDWLWTTAAQIRSIDPNHLISTGNEGRFGCENDMEMYEKIHSCPDIDYMTIHIWPYNWGWISNGDVQGGVQNAINFTEWYINEHVALAEKCSKPLVIEEFGYPRDDFNFTKGSPTTGRDTYYSYIFNRIVESKAVGGKLAGLNFWGWGGLAGQSQENVYWQKGDDYCGDPAQEQQGLNSVYLSDESTMEILKNCENELAGTSFASVSGDTPKSAIITALKDAARQGKVLYGHQDDLCYGHAWVADPSAEPVRSDVKDVCGDYPAVLGFDLSGIEVSNPENIDGVPFDFMRRAAVRHFERGGIVTFSWHTINPLTGGDAWDISSKEAVSYVLDNAEGKAKFTEWLGRCADFLSSLKTADGEVIPVIFRPWHEHTGSWFWWGKDLCTVDEYVRLWTMTYDYLVNERGLGGIVWAYSPSVCFDVRDYMERYPGDRFVDILGIDFYQYGELPKSNDMFIQNVGKVFEYMAKLGEGRGKPVALTEAGLEGIPNHKWWTEVLIPAINGSPVSYVLTWRNAHDKPTHYFGPWSGSGDEADFREFHNLPETVFLNDLKL